MEHLNRALRVGAVRCGGCDAESGITHVCGGCLVTAYCGGAACQRKHWASGHAQECRAIRSLLFVGGRDANTGAIKKRKIAPFDDDGDDDDDYVINIADLGPGPMATLVRYLSNKDALSLSTTQRRLFHDVRVNLVRAVVWAFPNVETMLPDDGDPSTLWKLDVRKISIYVGFGDTNLVPPYITSIQVKEFWDESFEGDLAFSLMPNLVNFDMEDMEDFDDPVDFTKFPKLAKLRLGSSFNQPINLAHIPRLTKLRMGTAFNQAIDLTKVPELVLLRANEAGESDFNQKLDLTNVPKLRKLMLSADYLQDALDLSKVPNLVELVVMWPANQQINLTQITNIEYLSLGPNFNQPLDLTLLPKLDGIFVSEFYNRDLLIGGVPEGVFVERWY